MSKWDSAAFGSKMRGKRAELRMTQSELADRIGVSFITVSNYECGKTAPNSNDIPRISNAFSLSADEVFAWGVVEDG